MTQAPESTGPEPTARGELARTPFAHALLYCNQHGLSGTLVVWPEESVTTRGQDRIRIERGVPVAASTLELASTLDRALLPLFSRRQGPYAFYADHDLVGTHEGIKTGRVDVHSLLVTAIRAQTFRDDIVDSVLQSWGETPLRLKAGTDMKRFGFLPKENDFVDVIRAAPAKVAELASECELGEVIGRRILYVFSITKALEAFTPGVAAPIVTGTALPLPSFESEKPPRRISSERIAAQKASADAPPSPPSSLSDEHRKQWLDIIQRAAEIERETYYQILGVGEDAPIEGIRRAYFALVKKWHPDRVPSELAPVKRTAERIFQLLTTAHDTLSDETKRLRYKNAVAGGGGTPESDAKLAGIVQAAMDHQKAEVLLKRRDFAGAIELLESALSQNGEDGDVHATYAWALYLEGNSARDALMQRAIERAVELRAESDRVHYYYGMILRKLGRAGEALSAFMRAAELNPKNIDAVREVRLARMRGEVPSKRKNSLPPRNSLSPGTRESSRPPARSLPPKASGDQGLLSKLFGNNKKEK